MIDLGIPDHEVQIAMRFGVYNLLAVLPKDELDKKGIPFIQTMIIDLIVEYYMTNAPEDKAWGKSGILSGSTFVRKYLPVSFLLCFTCTLF